MKRNKVGICKLCGHRKELTYEHIPPRKAYNIGSFITIPHDALLEDPFLDNAKGIKSQGGIGYYALCRDCNSFTGRMYGNAYIDFVNQIFYRYNLSDVRYIKGDPYIIHPLKVLKQIVSNLICISTIEYHQLYPELIDFVLNKESNHLPDKYQIFAYYNFKKNKYRFLADNYIWENGRTFKINEIAYPPLGIILSIDDPGIKIHSDLRNITNFKYFSYYRKDVWMNINLNILPVEIPGMPCDYRTREEIENVMKQSEENCKKED